VFPRFSGYGNPYPLAMFRILFYGGIALHFWPFVGSFGETFGRSSFRSPGWEPTWYDAQYDTGSLEVWSLCTIAYIGCASGLLGVKPRLAAMMSCAFYPLSSINSTYVQTLALGMVWAILPVWAIWGGGDEVLALGCARRADLCRLAPNSTRATISSVVAVALLMSGLSKLASGWPFQSDDPLRLFTMPQGTLLRDWVSSVNPALSHPVSVAIGTSVVVLEVVVPSALLLVGRSKCWLVGSWLVLFGAIVATLRIPPLFCFTYGAAGLLFIDDATYGWPFRRLGKLQREVLS